MRCLNSELISCLVFNHSYFVNVTEYSFNSKARHDVGHVIHHKSFSPIPKLLSGWLCHLWVEFTTMWYRRTSLPTETGSVVTVLQFPAFLSSFTFWKEYAFCSSTLISYLRNRKTYFTDHYGFQSRFLIREMGFLTCQHYFKRPVSESCKLVAYAYCR